MSGKALQILFDAMTLPPKEREDLIAALEREQKRNAAGSHEEIVDSICGKYAYVPTSSEEFIRRKREEVALED